MQISRAPKMEWNLNTLIQLVTLGGMIIGGIVIWVDKSRDIEDLQKWKESHEQLHKERLAEVKAIEASYNLRLSALEQKSVEAERKADNLTYRVTVTEQTTVSISTAIKELQADFNRQSSDIQVMKEILQRLETAINRSPPLRRSSLEAFDTVLRSPLPR
jgi:chromosome segregation ATPase